MAWIESHQALLHHPKVVDLMTLMGWDVDTTLGKLHRFWWWCVDYAENGDLRKHNADRLAAAVGVLPGDPARRFVEAMVAARWLDRDPYFRVHDWWQYVEFWLKAKYRNAPHAWMRIRNMYVTGHPNIPSDYVAPMKMDQWSRTIRERDGHVCRLCGAGEGQMHAHHILRQTDRPDLIFSVENGITLCRKCHKSIHGKEEKYVTLFQKKVSEKQHQPTNQPTNLTNQPKDKQPTAAPSSSKPNESLLAYIPRLTNLLKGKGLADPDASAVARLSYREAAPLLRPHPEALEPLLDEIAGTPIGMPREWYQQVIRGKVQHQLGNLAKRDGSTVKQVLAAAKGVHA